MTFYGCKQNKVVTVKEEAETEESVIGQIRTGWYRARRPDGTASIWDFLAYVKLEKNVSMCKPDDMIERFSSPNMPK
jgi:hypothetical protein